jgi:hypothetical protein
LIIVGRLLVYLYTTGNSPCNREIGTETKEIAPEFSAMKASHLLLLLVIDVGAAVGASGGARGTSRCPGPPPPPYGMAQQGKIYACKA